MVSGTVGPLDSKNVGEKGRTLTLFASGETARRWRAVEVDYANNCRASSIAETSLSTSSRVL